MEVGGAELTGTTGEVEQAGRFFSDEEESITAVPDGVWEKVKGKFCAVCQIGVGTCLSLETADH